MPVNPMLLPGAFTAVGTTTAATRALLQKEGRPVRKKRKKVAKKTAKRRPARKTAVERRVKKKVGKRLVKGSAAAKRRMAKLRAMQKKKR